MTKQQRIDIQNRKYHEMVAEMTEDVQEMYRRKIAKDAYYINFNNIVESVDYYGESLITELGRLENIRGY